MFVEIPADRLVTVTPVWFLPAVDDVKIRDSAS